MVPGQGGADPVVVREYRARSLTSDFLSRWEELEARALEGNAFLSPHFVLPALAHLPGETHRDPMVFAMESGQDGALLGLGLFEPSPPSTLLPFRHLQSWKCIHSFLDGMLLDRERGVEAADAFFRHLTQNGDSWHGVVFGNRPADSPLSVALDKGAARNGLSWHEDWGSERAVLMTSEIPENILQDLYGSKRRKTFRRSLRKLEKLGTVEYRLNWCENGFREPLDRFLRLESMGWKGEQDTALASDPGHERFIRGVVEALAPAGRACFSELTVSGEPAAMGLHFKARGTLFGFKIGWDPKYAIGSPGYISDLKFIAEAKGMEGVSMVDGCAVEGSWLESIWPWRRKLTSGVYPTTSPGRLAVAGTGGLKGIKRLLTSAG